jgi:hypothetical protein
VIVLAIDPGPTESAYYYGNPSDKVSPVIQAEKLPNGNLLRMLSVQPTYFPAGLIGIEEVVSYGRPVGAEVFHTVRMIGRLEQLFESEYEQSPILVPRSKMSAWLCLNRTAKDAHIRQRLIDLYGPGKDKAIGRKATPGPLYGMKADVWLAFAHGVHIAETKGELT